MNSGGSGGPVRHGRRDGVDRSGALSCAARSCVVLACVWPTFALPSRASPSRAILSGAWLSRAGLSRVSLSRAPQSRPPRLSHPAFPTRSFPHCPPAAVAHAATAGPHLSRRLTLPMTAPFTHFDAEGRAVMVDVGAKPETHRRARAAGRIVMQPATLARVRAGTMDKGDVIGIARIAAIQAAKRTADLIPLCHQLALTGVDVPDDRVVLISREEWLAADAIRTSDANPAAFGVIRGAVDDLDEVARRRGDARLTELAQELAGRCRQLRFAAYVAADADAPVEERLELRARSLELAVLSAVSVITARAGAGMQRGGSAERRLREAMFLQVQAQTAVTRGASVDLLLRRVRDASPAHHDALGG